jgi:hypothetical protein
MTRKLHRLASMNMQAVEPGWRFRKCINKKFKEKCLLIYKNHIVKKIELNLPSHGAKILVYNQ